MTKQGPGAAQNMICKNASQFRMHVFLYQVCVRTQNLMLQGLSHNQGPAQQAQQQQQQQSQTAAQLAAPQAEQVCPDHSSIAADSAVMSLLCAQELWPCRPSSRTGVP